METEEQYKSFELTVCVRDKHGNPTGETKTIRSNKGSDLAAHLEKYQPKIKREKKGKRRRGKKKTYIPNASEANTIIKTLYKEEK